MKNENLMRVFFVSGLFLVTGCLQTRSEVKESERERALQDQVVQYQKVTSKSEQRAEEVESTLRQLLGRVEVLEHEISVRKEDKDKKDSDAKERQGLLQEAVAQQDEEIKKLKTQITNLQQEIEDLRNNKSSKSVKLAKDAKLEDSNKGAFQEAEELFKEGDWKNAILNYEKYREINPKGKKLDEATYKIGLCFLELKMTDESRAFFEEVVRKYPSSSYAKKAKQKLK